MKKFLVILSLLLTASFSFAQIIESHKLEMIVIGDTGLVASNVSVVVKTEKDQKTYKASFNSTTKNFYLDSLKDSIGFIIVQVDCPNYEPQKRLVLYSSHQILKFHLGKKGQKYFYQSLADNPASYTLVPFSINYPQLIYIEFTTEAIFLNTDSINLLLSDLKLTSVSNEKICLKSNYNGSVPKKTSVNEINRLFIFPSIYSKQSAGNFSDSDIELTRIRSSRFVSFAGIIIDFDYPNISTYSISKLRLHFRSDLSSDKKREIIQQTKMKVIGSDSNDNFSNDIYDLLPSKSSNPLSDIDNLFSSNFSSLQSINGDYQLGNFCGAFKSEDCQWAFLNGVGNEVALSNLKKDNLYNFYLTYGDEAFSKKENTKALELYKKAHELKEFEKYPIEKIEEIDKLLKQK